MGMLHIKTAVVFDHVLHGCCLMENCFELYIVHTGAPAFKLPTQFKGYVCKCH